MITSEGHSPRAGTHWDVPCTLTNNGNVDAPYVTVVAAISGQYSTGWLRDTKTLPRESDFPGVDWLNASPSSTIRAGVTQDAFWIRDLAPGQTATFLWRVNGIGVGPFQYAVLVHGGTADEVASFLANYADWCGEPLSAKPGRCLLEVSQILTSPVDWQKDLSERVYCRRVSGRDRDRLELAELGLPCLGS